MNSRALAAVPTGSAKLIIRVSVTISLIAFSLSCSAAGHGSHSAKPIHNSSNTHTIAARVRPLQDDESNFTQTAGEIEDDLSELGSVQYGLPLDVIDVETDFESLQVDAMSLQLDLESGNPNDACNDADQGRIDLNAIFGDQNGYGSDISLASSTSGSLEEQAMELARLYSKIIQIHRRTGEAVSSRFRTEFRALSAKVGRAAFKLSSTLQVDNPKVRHLVVRGVAIYRKMRKACASVR